MKKNELEEIQILEKEIDEGLKNPNIPIKKIIKKLMKVCGYYSMNSLYEQGYESIKTLADLCCLEYGNDNELTLKAMEYKNKAEEALGIEDDYGFFSDMFNSNDELPAFFDSFGKIPGSTASSGLFSDEDPASTISRMISTFSNVVDKHGYDSDEASTVCGTLAIMLCSFGVPEMAIDFIEKAIDTLGEKDEIVYQAIYASLAGGIYDSMKDHDSALLYRKKAAELYAENGADETTLLNSLIDVNKSRISGGLELDEAMLSLIDINNKLICSFGADCPLLISCSDMMADIHIQYEDYEKARDCFRYAFSQGCQTYSNDHEVLMMLHVKLIDIYIMNKEFDQALQIAEKAFRLFSSGELHDKISLMVVMGLMGNIYTKKGELEKARVLLEENEQSWEDIGEGSSLDALDNMQYLAENYIASGDLTKAVNKLIRIYKVSKSAYGEEHIDVLYTMRDIADIYLSRGRRGDKERAIRYLEEALEILLRCYGPLHVLTEEIRDILDRECL